MKIKEEPLCDEVMAEIRDCATKALAVLGVERHTMDTAAVVQAIDEFIYHLQRDDDAPRHGISDDVEARMLMGSLWGEQIVKEFSWNWAKVTFDDGNRSEFGVLSPNRSLAIYPFDFLLCCFESSIDVTIMLCFNMLRAGAIPEEEMDTYDNLMHGIRRIVPRD